MGKKLQTRALVVAGFFVLVFSLLSARLVFLQVVKHEELSAKVGEGHRKTETLHADRGSILDRNGEILARDHPTHTVIADMYHLKHMPYVIGCVAHAEGVTNREVRKMYDRQTLLDRSLVRVANKVGPAIGIYATEVLKMLNSGKAEIELQKNLEEWQAHELRRVLKENKITGIYTNSKSQRIYPSRERLSHVVGFVNKAGEGRGVESKLHETLKGEDGVREWYAANDGGVIPSMKGRLVPPRDGHNVVLTVDMGLQHIVEECVQAHIPRVLSDQITVVLMDPFTGEVLSMCNSPTYDPNDLSINVNYRTNHAAASMYEIGSIFKPITTAACIDAGLVNLDTLINCENGYYEEGHIILRDSKPHLYLTVADVHSESSNIGTYKIARQLGKHQFHSYMEKFGFGKKTGIRLRESPGQIVKPSNYTATTLSSGCIGYANAISPLQICTALSAIVNGGQLMQPRIVKAITDPMGNPLETFQPHVKHRVISEYAAGQVRKAMIRTVSRGTGTTAQVPGYSVGGKTGTAWMVKNGTYHTKRRRCSFVGYLPAEDPRLLALVMVTDPQVTEHKRYGGPMAGPIFAEIAAKAMKHMEVEPTMTLMEEEEAQRTALLNRR